MQFREVGASERIDHDALDVRLHCGYSLPMASITRTIFTVTQSVPDQHARPTNGAFPFVVYRSHVRGVAERHCRNFNASRRATGSPATFEVVPVSTTHDEAVCRPDEFWSSDEVSRCAR